jgi:hypothetical protein
MTSSIENREPDMAIREDSSSSENEDDEDNELFGVPPPVQVNEVKISEANSSKKGGKPDKKKMDKAFVSFEKK